MTDTIKTTIVAGLFALLGGIGGASITGISQISLAKQKFNSDLVLKALESGSPEQRLESLKLLTETNLIQDDAIKNGVREYTLKKQKDPASIPQVIPTSSPVTTTPKSNAASNENTLSAFEWEAKGFSYLLDKDVDGAIKAFGASENAYNGYHNAYDIQRYLKTNREHLQASEEAAWKNVYSVILSKYSWGMPTQVRDQFKARSQ